MSICMSMSTCMRSDHSVGRCLLYGAWTTPVSVVCHSSAPPSVPTPPHVRTGFCFSVPFCNISEHITCHRYKSVASTSMRPTTTADASDLDTTIFQVVRLPKYEKSKFKYSSGFDGNITDSYL